MTTKAKTETFVYATFIRTTPEKLWEALTNGDFSQKYWFGSRIEVEQRVGGRIRIVPPAEVRERKGDFAGQVLACEKNRKLTYTWNPKEAPETAAKRDGLSRVTYEITPMGEQVKLRVIHENLLSDDIVGNPNTFQGVNNGWPAVISSLKSLLETGREIVLDSPWNKGCSGGVVAGGAIGGEMKKSSGYEMVDGLRMYYEIKGSGAPLIFIPPAFGFAGMKSFPELEAGHSVITVDLQGNGRTNDIPGRPITIEQYAKDVVGLMKKLGIAKADFLGESYGGVTAVMIAVRHPEMTGRVAAYSATFGPPAVAHNPAMTHYEQPPTAESRDIQFQRESFKKVSSDPGYWPKIYAKVGAIHWTGFSDAELASIKAPVLIIVGDHDFVRVEHAAESVKRIPSAEIAVIPDASHFALTSEQERVVPIIKHFLEKPEQRLPLATAAVGYHPGETR